MLDMEYIENDYSVLLDNPEPEKIEETNTTQVATDQGQTASREDGEPSPWWSLQYYQRFFDVTTEEVVGRFSASMMPLQSQEFLRNAFQDKPDLYGPLWICATLALETGVSSQTAYYFHHDSVRSWRQTVRTVYQAAVLLFLYCWCLPTFLWIGLEWNLLATRKFRLPELWCAFGYATALLLPATASWALPFTLLRWVTVNAAVITTGVFVCRYLKDAFSQIQRPAYYAVLALFFGLHCLVGYSFLLLFFPGKPAVDTKIHRSIISSSPLSEVILNQTFASVNITSKSSNNSHFL